jgi:hypothetical protein
MSVSVSPTVTTPQTPRVRRKPVPKFEYSVRYPKPDPNDPLAPLSTLRSRHPDGAIYPALPPFSPSTIVEPTPTTSSSDLPAFTRGRQEHVASDPHGRRYTIQARSASAQGFRSVNAMSGPVSAPAFDIAPSQLQRQQAFGTALDVATNATPENRRTVEKRKRARSIGASSSTLLPAVPPLPANLASASHRRHVPRPDLRPSSRDSESSNFVSSHLADFHDYPLHLLHTVATDSAAAEPAGTRSTTVYSKTMRVMDVDTPSQHMMREASQLSNSLDAALVAEHATARRSTVKKKASRLSLFTRSRPSTPVHTLPHTLPASAAPPRPSVSSQESDTSYTTAASTPTPPTSASSAPSSRESSPRGRTLIREPSDAPSNVCTDGCTDSEDAKATQKPRRSRTLSRISRTLHRKSSSPVMLKSTISSPMTAPVAIPMVSTKATWAAETPQSAQPELAPRAPAWAPALASAPAPTSPPAIAPELLQDGSVHAGGALRAGIPVSSRTPRTPLMATLSHPPPALTRSKTAHQPAPLRPKRSHLRSVSDPHALSTATRPALSDARPVPPVPARTRALAPPPPPRFEQPTGSEPTSAFYNPPSPPPTLYNPPSQPRTASGSPNRPLLPKLAPLAPLAPPATRLTPRTLGPISPVRSFPATRRRPGSGCDLDGQRSPVGRRPVATRSQTTLTYAPKREHAHEHSAPVVGLGALPSAEQLDRAARMIVLKENGLPVVFGDLWETRRTVVLFIRHFWCVRLAVCVASECVLTQHRTGVHRVRNILRLSCMKSTTLRCRTQACS